MKKIITCLLLLSFIFQYMPVSAATFNGTKTASIAIPISTGLIGNEYASKNFSLNLPSGISASSVITSTLKYVGSNSVASLQLSGSNINLKLSGVANNKTVNVDGLLNGQDPFTTNIGNNIWRYSDGRTWQINDYNDRTDRQYHYDKPATDSGMPSKIVTKVVVNAASEPSTVGRSWKTAAKELIPDQYVQKNTIKVDFLSSSPWVTGTKLKNNKIVTSYNIPIVPNDIEGTWLDVTSQATMPIIQHVQGRFYQASVNYIYKATANIPTFSYGGTVTFEYKLPTEPTLSGEVGLLAPNPNPILATGKDIPVKLSIKGLLSAYTDTTNIQEWVFYAKETGKDNSILTKKDQSKVLTSQQTFDFIIPKEKASASRFTQNYTLTVTVRFSKPVITSVGSITSLSETFTINAGTYTGPGPSDMPTPTPTPVVGSPPVARITSPTRVKAGTSFIVSGANSYDKDGTIVSYTWKQPNAELALYGKQSDTRYGLDSIGTSQTIYLTVTDNDGLTGTTSHDIEIIAPVPEPVIVVSGTLKENRKITLSNMTYITPDDIPLVKSKTKFTIKSLDGISEDKIKYSGSLAGTDNIDFLVRTPGNYLVTLYVENTAGFGASTSKTLNVLPDEKPIPYISIPSGAYRDPNDGNRAKIVLDDLSISPDYDYLAHRLWQYRYDSNNNGNFEEEAWVTISDGNMDRLELYLTEVGRYEVRLTVREEFGQPTIDQFVTAADRRFANTDSQNSVERTITVYNRRPETDWIW